MNTKKKTFSNIFILFIVMMVSLPFLTTFEDILTRILMGFEGYRILQNFVVPYEMQILASVLSHLHMNIQAGVDFIQFTRFGHKEAIYLIWNCVGWQSFIVFLITLITGFSGNFTFMSKIESFTIGALGTYLINIVRLVLVVIMYYFTGHGIGIIFHDYFSSLLSIAWLFIFWWMSYKFFLQEISTD